MPVDVQELVKQLVANAVEGYGKSSSPESDDSRSNGHGPLSGMKGMLAGAGAAALLPVAAKTVGKRLGIEDLGDLARSPGDALGGVTSKLTENLTSGVGDKIGDAVDDAGGPAGILKSALPFGGGGGDKGGATGVGKGRRMPVQQSIDIAVPIETVYNQWTQFEDWPTFMHRVTRATQEDDRTVSFAVKIWGKTKEFTAKIETQRPDQRLKWEVTQGMTHTGVVTFHELGPSLTRILLSLDVDPGSLLEKFARGARHVKRAARGDLHRFKAFIEMAENETGAWRGVIEEEEIVEEHDPAYDQERDYADRDQVLEDLGGEGAGEDSEEEEEDKPRARSRRRSASRDGSEADEEPAPKRSSRQRRVSSQGRSSSQGRGSSARGRAGSSRAQSGSSRGRSGSSRSRSGAQSGRSSGGRSASARSRSQSSRSRAGSSRGSSGGQSSGRRSRSGKS